MLFSRMHSVKEKFVAGFIGMTIFLGGCSDATPIPSGSNSGEQAPSLPIHYLADCQVNPLDHGKAEFLLEDGQEVRVGVITITGRNDVILIEGTGNGSLDYKPETNFYIGTQDSQSADIQDDNMRVTAEANPFAGRTQIAISMTCI